MYRHWLPILIPLLLLTSATAQRGTHLVTLTVHVSLANEQPAPDQLRVELLTGSGIVTTAATTHSSGVVEFPMVAPGDYRLRISGNGIEDTTTGVFAISPIEMVHSEFVRVRIKSAAAGEPPPPSGRATVSPSDLKAPKKAVEEYNEGNKALAHSRWEDARKHFENAVGVDAQFASAYHNLGVACTRLNDLEEARRAFSTAIRLDPRLTSAYLNLARFEFTTHNFAAVKDVLRKCISTASPGPEALMMLSEAELLTGEYEAALTDARKVQGPNFAIAHYVAGQALEAQGRSADAVAEYQAFLKEKPDGPEAPRVRAALDRLQRSNR